MASRFPLQALRGPFNFLAPRDEEVSRLFGDVGDTLPPPQTLFLDDEEATPITGFALLATPGLARLSRALEEHLFAEERVQVAACRRQPPDRAAQGATWERYRELLARAVENATLSSYGRSFPAIFWLHHSLEVARVLKETPRRVLREDTDVGRRQGDAIRYRVLERWLDRVLSEVYDQVTRLAADTEEIEEELFPRLLTRLRDNVLLLTEDHVGPDLAELSGYFNGHLGMDGRDLRRRLDEVEAWHQERLAADRDLAAVVRHLLDGDPRAVGASRQLLTRPGYLTYLASRSDYQAAARGERLVRAEQVAVWESLLVKLKEFELVHALRRMVFLVQRDGERDGGRLVARGSRVRAASGRAEVVLSATTRPLDFMAPWVVDPQVARFGLIYDITDFTHTVSTLRRSGMDVQDDAFRGMFRLQRRIHRAAGARRLRLEKYLGDGAFYSGRFATHLLAAAIHAQRIYRQALGEGLPFDRGMRLALNYSEYRLLPIAGAGDERYEFFGHGVIELTRLTTGKAMREIDEVKAMLLAMGYPELAVHRFFAPLQRDDRTDREAARPFRAWLDRNGHLVNEGIVATEAFVAALDAEAGLRPLAHVADGDRGFVVLRLDDAAGSLAVGLRRLGVANLKGLDRATLYEVVDADVLGAEAVPVAAASLGEALDREVAGTLLEAAG